MEFFETLQLRRSIRGFAPKPVDDSVIQQILEAANIAPSAGNLQAFEIAVVTDAPKITLLAETAFRQMFVAGAAVAIVFFANPERNREKYGALGESLFAPQDATIACAYAELAAAALGLGACWIGAFSDDDVVRTMAGAPASWKPVAMLAIGRRGDYQPDPRERRPLDDIVRRA